jgi:hypothetical protein
MIYSICLFDICDFESIGRKMPKGTGVDCSLNDTDAPKQKAKKRVESHERAHHRRRRIKGWRMLYLLVQEANRKSVHFD